MIRNSRRALLFAQFLALLAFAGTASGPATLTRVEEAK